MIELDKYLETNYKLRNLHKWQRMALDYAQQLSIRPDANWFKLFKTNYPKNEGRLRSCLSFCIDVSHPDIKKLFYWRFYNAPSTT